MPKVAKDGRVTVPKRVRDYLGLAVGTEVTFRRAHDGSVIIERADGTRPPSRLAKVIGSAGPGLSTDELMALLRGD
jgi:antitoxin PrlF